MNTEYKKIENCKIGEGTKVWNFVNLYECEIGKNCVIGSFVEIGRGVKIGNNCKIESGAFIPPGVAIEDDVFIGPNVVFINDRRPRSKGDWKQEKTLVKREASIGANATIMCGITVGEKAMIGAGSVVLKNVPNGSVVVGNPARQIR